MLPFSFGRGFISQTQAVDTFCSGHTVLSPTPPRPALFVPSNYLYADMSVWMYCMFCPRKAFILFLKACISQVLHILLLQFKIRKGESSFSNRTLQYMGVMCSLDQVLSLNQAETPVLSCPNRAEATCRFARMTQLPLGIANTFLLSLQKTKLSRMSLGRLRSLGKNYCPDCKLSKIWVTAVFVGVKVPIEKDLSKPVNHLCYAPRPQADLQWGSTKQWPSCNWGCHS